MTSIKHWIAEHSNQPNQLDQAITASDLRFLLSHLLQRDSAWLYTHSDEELNGADLKQLSQWFEQLKQGYPLAYITGKQAFWDLELTVNEHTLIPRPDTEILIEVCIELLPQQPRNILDLGTGSGAIALALAKVFKQAEVIGVDVSKQAIETAKLNAKNCAIENVIFKTSDWFSAIKEQTFDLIVSNPPYIAADDEHLVALQHEPSTALIANDAGLADYKAICAKALSHMNPSGFLVFEHGWQQKQAVSEIMSQSGLIQIKTVKDLAGHDRITHGKKSPD
ncbi:peptide chain release factor N(5)-glutamine methyltransferase [Marinicella sp. S1101]|uniref:peptide chain release factor N(5)-glutamine methyltransferase n=1 Tax=Marinicella marina TaxID=2996016 RepID=UPI00226095E1|nr:peptide chain release factor N(5)-glutamine methyltransferase [Marinicella marina]MCX7552981.1 peptide chain release factor N(5)-glutamine methyltransferase [Marinicella marina]MDJ1139709.1 peptide chain release factor N(5)-glutamine methyltransferase [Marinicella marina]